MCLQHVEKKEVSKRIAETHVTWKRLEEFWKRGNRELTEQIIVYDAVVRTKLMYGLESLQLNKELPILEINIFAETPLNQSG